MNKKLIITAVTASLLALNMGQTANAAEKSDHSLSNNISKYITLAQSHNIYFEMIPRPFYTIGLVKYKEQLPYGLIFGGKIQLDPQYWNGEVTYSSINNRTNGSTIALSGTNLDFMGNINDWSIAFMQLEKSSPTKPSIQLGRAAIILGNLSKSPFYAAFGQINLQFGSFAPDAGPWSNGLDTNAFRPSNHVKQVSLGYYKNGLTAGIALFQNKNSSSADGSTNLHNIKDFMISSRYENTYKPANIDYKVGAGFINDMRYINTTFGNGYDSATKANSKVFTNANGITNKHLPVLDLNAEITLNQLVSVKAEYDEILTRVTTTNSSGGETSLTIKNKRPAAWAISGSYTPTIYGEKTTFWVAYSQTQNMQGLPIGLAGNSYSDNDNNGLKHAWNFSIYRTMFSKHNILAFDFQRVKNYAGKTGNTYTIDDNYYF